MFVSAGTLCHQIPYNYSPQQVFWLSDHPSGRCLPLMVFLKVAIAHSQPFVPDYSGGTATVLHRVPIC